MIHGNDPVQEINGRPTSEPFAVKPATLALTRPFDCHSRQRSPQSYFLPFLAGARRTNAKSIASCLRRGFYDTYTPSPFHPAKAPPAIFPIKLFKDHVVVGGEKARERGERERERERERETMEPAARKKAGPPSADSSSRIVYSCFGRV